MKDEASDPAASFELAGFRVDPPRLRVKGSAGDTRLEAKAMAVLLYLVRHAGKVVSRNELERHLWPGRVVTEDAVTNTILKLRRAFGDNARDPHVIETIPKTGYRLIAQVRWLGEAGSAPTAVADSTSAGQTRARTHRAFWLAGVCLLVLALAGKLLNWEQLLPLTRDAPYAKPTLAILPFQNLGASPEQDYFANGLTADLITDLSKVSGVLVTAPGSVYLDHDVTTAMLQVPADLGADYVLIGSVQRSGDRLRVNVQLIGAAEERALWGERYEGTAEDVFSIQDGLATDVIAALRVKLAPDEREVVTRRSTKSVVAYDAYLRGIEAHGHRAEEQNLIAKEYFRNAIKLDPGFAMAYTGLALSHSRDAIDGWVTTPLPSLERAAELVGIASAIDPSLPQVHFVTGQVELFRRRHVQAIKAAELAIRTYPNYADGYALSAWILNYAGRNDEAETAIQEALRLNPRPSASYLEVLGEIRFVQRRYPESVRVFEQVLDINPNYARARMWIAAALALAGDIERAEWEAMELRTLSPGFTLQRLQFAFPFRDSRELDIVMQGLRKAGLPE